MQNINNNLLSLYLFENDDFFIAEIKKNEPKKTLKPDEKFFWLLYRKDSETTERLQFKSMNSSDDFEYRVFYQAELKFNKTDAFFSYNENIHQLKKTSFIPTKFKNSALRFFS